MLLHRLPPIRLKKECALRRRFLHTLATCSIGRSRWRTESANGMIPSRCHGRWNDFSPHCSVLTLLCTPHMYGVHRGGYVGRMLLPGFCGAAASSRGKAFPGTDCGCPDAHRADRHSATPGGSASEARELFCRRNHGWARGSGPETAEAGVLAATNFDSSEELAPGRWPASGRTSKCKSNCRSCGLAFYFRHS